MACSLSLLAPLHPDANSSQPSAPQRASSRNPDSDGDQQRTGQASGKKRTRDDAATPRPIGENEIDKFNPQHLLVPLSNVSKLMKYSLPSDAKVSNPSKILVQNCVSEFCNFIGSNSNLLAKDQERKTINGVDLIISLKDLGLLGYYQCLKIYLVKYRTAMNEMGKRNRRSTQAEGVDAQVEGEMDQPQRELSQDQSQPSPASPSHSRKKQRLG